MRAAVQMSPPEGPQSQIEQHIRGCLSISPGGRGSLFEPSGRPRYAHFIGHARRVADAFGHADATAATGAQAVRVLLASVRKTQPNIFASPGVHRGQRPDASVFGRAGRPLRIYTGYERCDQQAARPAVRTAVAEVRREKGESGGTRIPHRARHVPMPSKCRNELLKAPRCDDPLQCCLPKQSLPSNYTKLGD